MWARSLADGERYEASASVCSMCLGIGFVLACPAGKQADRNEQTLRPGAGGSSLVGPCLMNIRGWPKHEASMDAGTT